MQVFNATPLYVLDICEVCGSRHWWADIAPISARPQWSSTSILLPCSVHFWYPPIFTLTGQRPSIMSIQWI